MQLWFPFKRMLVSKKNGLVALSLLLFKGLLPLETELFTQYYGAESICLECDLIWLQELKTGLIDTPLTIEIMC